MKHLQKFETFGFEEELGIEVEKPTCDSCGCEDCGCDPTEKHEGGVCPSCGCEDCECVRISKFPK
jgi:hypothetical protein